MSRSLAEHLSHFDFVPVVKHNAEWHIFDFTEGYDPTLIRQKKWGLGRYNEQRVGMYVAPQYKNRRNIHIGIDFWTPPEEPVFAFFEGEIAYFRNNARQGDYGPTIVTRHQLGPVQLFALYGHLTLGSIREITEGQPISKGQEIARVGHNEENGGWEPHLHFQLSLEDPGQADMPGVVAQEKHQSALEKYPDPRLIVGDVY